MPTETTIVEAIVDALAKRGAWVLKIHGSSMQQRGIPDLLCCIQGRFFGIEVKQPGNVPSPMQEYQMKSIRKSGGVSFATTSAKHTLFYLEQCGVVFPTLATEGS